MDYQNDPRSFPERPRPSPSITDRPQSVPEGPQSIPRRAGNDEKNRFLKKYNFWKHLLRIWGVLWSISTPNYVQNLIFLSKNAWPCRQIRIDPSNIVSRVRTLFTALERCWARSVHYMCIIREVSQCYIYSVRIAFYCSQVSRIVCGSHLQFLEVPRGSQAQSTHYTRYISSI